MATDEDKKDELETKADEASEPTTEPKDETATDESIVNADDDKSAKDDRDDEVAGAAPIQLGTRRFVYAAYFAGAIAIAFLGSKIGNLIWGRLEVWKPEIGDPKDDLIMPIAAVIGALVAFYYWKRQATRQYAEEVASELAQVTWPSRSEVTNSTTVVIIATAFATIFFALMDRFWAFLTDLVYRF